MVSPVVADFACRRLPAERDLGRLARRPRRGLDADLRCDTAVLRPGAVGQEPATASARNTAFSASLRRASAARLVRSVRCRDQACFVGGDDELDPVSGVQLGQ
jgi:hypothetical protein